MKNLNEVAVYYGNESNQTHGNDSYGNGPEKRRVRG